MINTIFKYVHFNDRFIHDNTEYVKTNKNRGYYWKDGVKIFKVFNKKSKVKTENSFWDCPINIGVSNG